MRNSNDSNYADDLSLHLQAISPVIRPDDNHRKRLRLILQHGQSAHKRSRTLLALSLACLSVLLLFGHNNELGSDSFEMTLDEPVQDAEDRFNEVLRNIGSTEQVDWAADKSRYMAVNRDQAVTIPNNLTNDPEAAERYATQMNEAIMANTEVIVDVFSFAINDDNVFFINKRIVIDGEPKMFSSPCGGKTEQDFNNALEFSLSHRKDFDAKIADGTASYVGTTVREFDGTRVLFHKWSATFPQWGEVIAWLGKPVD